MVARDTLKGKSGLFLNTIVISLAIALNSGIYSETPLHIIHWQNTDQSKAQQEQPFRPAKLGLPTRREGGGCR